MATDAEKVEMLDKGYALKVASKACESVAKALTAIELSPQSADAVTDEKLRQRLADSRDVCQAALSEVKILLDRAIRGGVSKEGPLFDTQAEVVG